MKHESIQVLNQLFDVRATYYKLHVAKRLYRCRGVAEIRRKGSRESKCDALVIVSDPGNCSPIDTRSLFHVNPSDMSKVRLQKARASPVYFQLMRLCNRMNWNLMYVISLTDICSINARSLAHELKFMEKNRIEVHSLFTTSRQEEVGYYLDSKTKVIAGWGTRKSNKNIAQIAFDLLNKRGVVFGVNHDISPFYYHPYSFKNIANRNWLDKMENQLKRY